MNGVAEELTITRPVDLAQLLDVPKRVEVAGGYVLKGDYATALALCESVLELDPDNVAACVNGAFVLFKQGNFARAAAWIARGLRLEPENPVAWNISAQIEQAFERYDIACIFFEKTIALAPARQEFYLNYGYLLQLIADYPKAYGIYTKARDLDVLNFNTRFQRALCMMTLARTQEEWTLALDEYEVRHLLYNTGGRGIGQPKPLFTGDKPVTGQAILIATEQGVGDAVMTGRYARYLKRAGAKAVYLFCGNPAWVELMATIDDVDGVFSDPDRLPYYDCFIPAMSLLRVTGYPTVQASNEPYLRPPKPGTANHISLPAFSGKPRVGLCWAGNPAHGNDRYRSIGPELFGCHLERLARDVDFFSLHQDAIARPDFVKPGGAETLIQLAGLIGGMDLVVSVDTAQAHIAGAMGKRTFALLSRGVDWRWGMDTGALDRTDWYPSVRLFRAAQPLQWGPVLDRVASSVEREFACV